MRKLDVRGGNLEARRKKLGSFFQKSDQYLHASSEVLSEALWPTRCVLCDTYGSLLCPTCQLSLPYIDFWRICPSCGAPFGSVQCSECNPVMLKELGTEGLPFLACVSLTSFNKISARLVTSYKDRNERRLADVMACLLAEIIPPNWYLTQEAPAISFIPATKKAYQQRGFDHGELLAQRFAEALNLPPRSLLNRPASKDQRILSRHERIANMENRFTLSTTNIPKTVILIDDVYTTGSTLCAASKALLEGGCERVYCATFARVW